MRWLPLEAVKASCWHRVNLGDTDELVGGLIGSEGVLWPRLVADTVCGRLTHSAGPRGDKKEPRSSGKVLTETMRRDKTRDYGTPVL